MTVRCGCDEFKLHRAIVCPRSRFFATACNGQYKESQTRVITLKEDDPPTVRRMFTYLYTLDYDTVGGEENAASIGPYLLNASYKYMDATTAPSSEEARLRTQLVSHIAVYAIAEKYDIQEMKHLAVSKFATALKEPAADLSYTLSSLINAVFETTPSTDTLLRNVMTKYCHTHFKALIDDDIFLQTLSQHPDLCLGLVQEMITEREEKATQAQALAESHRHEVDAIKLRLEDMSREVDGMEYAAEEALQHLDEVPCSANDTFKALRKCVVGIRRGIQIFVREREEREVEDEVEDE